MKNSEKFTVVYNANDNYPEDVCHFKGRLSEFTSTKTKEFDNSTDAINFWYECALPITKLAELGVSCEISAIVEDMEELVMSEEPVANFSEVYNLVEEED